MFSSQRFLWCPFGRCLCSLVTLAAYLCATVVWPVADGSHPAAGCRCSEELKATGRCCCSKNLAKLEEASKKSCCQKVSRSSCCSKKSLTKSCCSSRLTQSSVSTVRANCAPSQCKTGGSCCRKPSKTAERSRSALLRVQACGCDGGPHSQTAWSADPRLIGETAKVESGPDWPTSLTGADFRFSNPHRLPETPPPKVLAA